MVIVVELEYPEPPWTMWRDDTVPSVNIGFIIAPEPSPVVSVKVIIGLPSDFTVSVEFVLLWSMKIFPFCTAFSKPL
mgnify:CR=1 FL=1